MAVKGFRLKIDSAGIRALLQSQEVAGDLARRAGAIADAAGGEPDFEVVNTRNRDRAVSFVRTASSKGQKMEAEDRALTRAIDAGR